MNKRGKNQYTRAAGVLRTFGTIPRVGDVVEADVLQVDGKTIVTQLRRVLDENAQAKQLLEQREAQRQATIQLFEQLGRMLLKGARDLRGSK